MRKGNWKLIHFWEDNHDELYNLVNDIHEDHNLAQLEIELTKKMSKTLLNWLKEVGAKYPKPDALYNETQEQNFITEKKTRVFKTQEIRRTNMLSKNWEPNKSWWGSIPTVN